MEVTKDMVACRLYFDITFLESDVFGFHDMEQWLLSRHAYLSISNYAGLNPRYRTSVNIEAYAIAPDRRWVGTYVKNFLIDFKKLNKEHKNELFIELNMRICLF